MHLQAWLSITTRSIKLIFQNITQNAEQKTAVVRFQTCYTSSTEGTILGSIWKNQQPPTVFLHDAKNHKYWTAVRHYACYRSSTNNRFIFFQKVLVFSNGKQSIEPCPIVQFGVLLFRINTNSSNAHTVGSNRVQRSLAVERLSTTGRHIKTTLLCLTYSLKAEKPIHGDMTTIQTQRMRQKPTIPRSHFMATPTTVDHMHFTLRLRAN